MKTDLELMGQKSQVAAQEIAQLSTDQKNKILNLMAQKLIEESHRIVAANQIDLAQAQDMPAKFIDRLLIDESRILGMAHGLQQVAQLADPIGDVERAWVNHVGLKITQQRVPLGVIGLIYEARPNVTVDASALCFKAGNTVILRGGKEALQTNLVLAEVLRNVLKESGINPDAIQIISETSHELANEFMRLSDYLSVLIPRGSKKLIQAVVKNATVPVIETGAGNCHVYIDESADEKMAVKIVENAKCQRPSVCNSAEKLIINEKIATQLLPKIAEELASSHVLLRGDQKVQAILGGKVQPATAEDWETEYNDYILAIKVVSDIDEAIQHINRYSTHHSEAIITNDYQNSQKFLNQIDSACVYVNASTRFTDGFEFGFGAEIGISTQKMHARGPMGLRELTTTKYLIQGSGQIRE
ncbi:glutamate-5-semialdehyde dehydrogenase [Ligilactobacillus ceti]|uniref:Gamma-glutamyl phosphate reductase n=1 Tax=Ligilactobacillus ceti DSM 22408 TaxID=1122146 RepID=A0A0R2KT07_9LACO|nr:glutamate-5-semialdehyde dehydrogenase [Ligilactobacillus ceti]KRN89357.1 gamma-glutamyl phosphate reductase [Ligilactobacillus ceti DSM 22408]